VRAAVSISRQSCGNKKRLQNVFHSEPFFSLRGQFSDSERLSLDTAVNRWPAISKPEIERREHHAMVIHYQERQDDIH
jgi:hypothetical protein